MEQNTNHVGAHNDVATSWVSTSRFIFYIVVASLVAFFLAACFGLYAHRYKGKPDIEIQSSTLYNPQYK